MFLQDPVRGISWDSEIGHSRVCSHIDFIFINHEYNDGLGFKIEYVIDH